MLVWTKTSRDRPKLAPYLRLKNSKRTSTCQSFASTAPKKKFEKSLTMPKNGREGDPLGIFFLKKVLQCRKNWNGDPLISSGIVCYARNLFGSVPWANSGNIKFCRTFGRTILVTSGVSKKNTDKKSWLWSTLFSRKAPTKNEWSCQICSGSLSFIWNSKWFPI